MDKKSRRLILIVVVFACSLFQALPSLRSGLRYPYGLGFWGPAGHDGIWHLSLINHISSPLNIPMPGFAGHNLVNYHPFFDILAALVAAITTIPARFILFQILPLLFSFGLSLFSFYIGYKLTHKFSAGLFLVFCNTFLTSFGWIVTLIRTGKIEGESLFWAMQSPSTQLNPPYALSLVFISILIILIINHWHKANFSFWQSLIIITILVLTPITKAYGGVAVYLIFGFYSLRHFFSHRYRPLKLLIISLVPAYLIFSFYNPSSDNLFVFKPFWFTNAMIDSPDRLYLPHLSSARFNLQSANSTGPKLIIVQAISLALFLLGNFGFRLIGLTRLNHSRLPSFSLIITATIFILTLIPLLFIQKGTGWNTIQFVYYALFLTNILLALSVFNIKSAKPRLVLIFLIIVLNLIGSWGTFKQYFGNPSPSALPTDEITALNFLKDKPPGTVLTHPYDPYVKTSLATPIPLYAYETSNYVSAFSHHLTFLEDEMNLENSGYDWQPRRKQSLDFFKQENIFEDRGFLVNNSISYIYLAGPAKNIPLDTQNLYLKPIFQNDTVLIYQVQR